jgi:glutathione S-transferase
LEKGLKWETTWLDLPSGEHKKPEYLAINPVGKVPALIDGETIVHDSTIINEYLEDKFPDARRLLPPDPTSKARARAFEDYADAYLMPSLFKIFWEVRKPEADRNSSKIDEGWREAQTHFGWLDRQLAGRDYVAGEFSLGDISFVPPVANLERAGFSIPVEFANLNAWWRRVKGRPSFRESWPAD